MENSFKNTLKFITEIILKLYIRNVRFYNNPLKTLLLQIIKKVNKMMKKILLIFIIFMISLSAFSDERDDNIDIFILLDKSLSMENNIEEVKKYISSYIIDNIVIKGDRLLIINFYGKTENFVDTLVEDNEIKNKLKSKITEVKADGRFTDIGSALDRLTEAAGEETERIRYMLLITDGKQEAPPGTRYYSPDGSFNHELLKHTKTIQKKGWKIEVLGIGKLNRAADIAEKLSGTYVEVEKADAGDLAEKTSDLLTVISVKGKPEIEKLNRKNESVINIKVVSSNTEEKKEIVIKSIIFSAGSSRYEMLQSPFSFEVEAGTENIIEIPVKIRSEINPGKISGTVEFFYSSENILTPSLFDTELEKSKGISPAMIYIPSGIIILILLLMILRKILPSGGKEKDRGFEVFIDNEKISELPYILKNNEKLFLVINRAGEFSLSRIKSAFARGYLIRTGNRIDFKILDSKLFPDFKDKIDNIIGKSVNIKMNSGKLLKLLFKRK